MIPFNKPYISGKEIENIKKVIFERKLAGNGIYTKKCEDLLEQKYKFKKCFLTSSCTDALEMTAILADIQKDDEVIMPSYTFVSTANAFILRGAKIVFADSSKENPNIDADSIEELISNKTKAIVIVHYAGVACEMGKIMDIAQKYSLFVIEDCAHSIDSYYNKNALGTVGHFATFSFHETKNISSGEGGVLVVNDEKNIKRAEIILEKGTNRSEFLRGEINKYGWVDIGSSFLPSEITAAFLYAQLEEIDKIQQERINKWNYYYEYLRHLDNRKIIRIQKIPDFATNNAHIFYFLCNSENEKTNLIQFLKEHGINATFHYIPLHLSAFYQNKHDGRKLKCSEYYFERLIRLPLYFDLKNEEIKSICQKIYEYYKISNKIA